MATENGTGKVEEDLAYVRAVVDRQRQVICEAVPIWFAALTGIWLASMTSLRDLVDHGMVAESLQDWVGNGGPLVLIGILLWRAARRRQRRQGANRPRFAGREVSRIVLPWVAMVAGLILLKSLGSTAGLEKDVLRPFMFAYVAVTMTIIGLSSIHTVLGFGLGMVVGTIAFAFLNLAFPFSAFGICAGLGLLIGAYADQQRVRRA